MKGDDIAAARQAERLWFGEGIPKSEEKALMLYSQVASHGDVRIQRKLGKLYSMPGPTMDTERTVYWSKMAAENGESESQLFLGLAFCSGDVVDQSYEESIKYL